MFKKGHKGYNKPKKERHQFRSGEWKTARLTSGKQSVSRYIYALEWAKGMSKKTMNQEEVDYRLNNNLPLDDLFDNLDK